MDYKTDRVKTGGAEDLAARYRPQVTAYGSALEAAGTKVKEVGFWFSSTGETWTSGA